MLHTARSYNGMVVSPHHLASEAGLAVLREGGNAIEAMVAAASTIAVVYPHMNGLGGDNFWLIRTPEGQVHAIDSCGQAASAASMDWYREQGHTNIPERGPLAALTVAGAVAGWQSALELSTKAMQGKLPLSRLLDDAIRYAREGVAVPATLANNAAAKFDQLEKVPGWKDRYAPNGKLIRESERLLQPEVSATLEQLVKAGLADFYNGDIATSIARDLQDAGSPLSRDDLQGFAAKVVEPLHLQLGEHALYNMPPPTQGLASLLLLAVFERLYKRQLCGEVDSFAYVHAIVESTKAAFRIRDSQVTDPDYMSRAAESFLDKKIIDQLESQVDPARAAPWPDAASSGDTVWLGAIDSNGCAVSFIQSIFWEFGSGLVLPGTGASWQNRGSSFSLDKNHHNCLQPGRRPFHTIQPALAVLGDGRVMPYGTMGGEGQPQTQAMLFTRHVYYQQSLQESVTAPRWLLGKTWGSDNTNLRIESGFDESVYAQLIAAEHDVERVGAFEEFMGHAGALVLHTKGEQQGMIEGAYDPRSDGKVAAF